MSVFDSNDGDLLAEIDAEHLMLSSRIVKLEQVCPKLEERTSCKDCPPEKTSGCAEAFIQEIGDLLAYMVDHFRHEERGMRGCGYADMQDATYAAHVEDHANLSGYFTGIVSEFDERDPSPHAVKLRALLQKWIAIHINEFDAHLLSHLGGTDRSREVVAENAG